MTREEAIRIIKTMEINNRPANNSVEACKEVANRFIALDMAIKALEQEPREDATLKDIFCMGCEYKEQEPKTEQEDDYFRKIVEVAISQLRADRDRLEDELAKREQEPKTGHWMIVHRKGIYTHLVCDKCLSNAPYDCRTNYCPNCGAKMVEPQESEE